MPSMERREAEIQRLRRERMTAERTAAGAAAVSVTRKRRVRRVVYGLVAALAIAGITVGLVEGAVAIVAASVGVGALIAIAGWAGREPNKSGESARVSDVVRPGSF